MIELLLLFSFWPWALLILILGVFTVSTWAENVQFALIGIVLYSASAWIFYDVNPFMWAYDNPGTLISYGTIYFAVGAAWSVFKWRNKLLSKNIQYAMNRAKDEYKPTPEDAGDPKAYMKSNLFPSGAIADENKNQIFSWFLLWPFSVVGYFFGQLLTDIALRIYNLMSGVYDRLTKHYAP